MTRDLFDALGYLVGVGLLVVIAFATLRRKTAPRLAVEFILPAFVLFIWTGLPDAHANRWLGFMGLWLAWYVAQLPLPWERIVKWGLSAFALAVVADAAFNLGRPMDINPNMAASVLLLGLGYAPLPLVAAGLFATQSRGAIAGLFVSGALLLWPRLTLRRRWALLAAVGFGLTALISLRPETAWARVEHWSEALRLIAASPIIGWGTSAYMWVSSIPYQVHADSAPLTLLAEHGLGVMAFIPLLVLAWRRWPQAPLLVRLGLLAFALQNLVDDTWLYPWPAILLGLNLGLLWELYGIRKTALAAPDPAASAAGAPAADQLQPMV